MYLYVHQQPTGKSAWIQCEMGFSQNTIIVNVLVQCMQNFVYLLFFPFFYRTLLRIIVCVLFFLFFVSTVQFYWPISIGFNSNALQRIIKNWQTFCSWVRICTFFAHSVQFSLTPFLYFVVGVVVWW